MIDKENVINELVKHIENALSIDSDYVDCVRTDLLQTVVGMLKEQEPVKPDKPEEVWLCGNCGEIVGWDDWIISTDDVRHKYCPGCGRKVKWDETD